MLCALIGLSACNMTFKKKYNKSEKEISDLRIKATSPKKYQQLLEQQQGQGFSQKDKKLINLYYKDKANANTMSKAASLTPVSKKEDSQLKISHHLPPHIQVVPLPLELEKILGKLPRQVLRVQVARNIILMNVKTRKIIDIIKF